MIFCLGLQDKIKYKRKKTPFEVKILFYSIEPKIKKNYDWSNFDFLFIKKKNTMKSRGLSHRMQIKIKSLDEVNNFKMENFFFYLNQ